MSEHVLTEHQIFESRKRALDFNRMVTGHHEHGIKHMTGNVRLESMDETMGDYTKDPERVLQRGLSAAETEDAAAERTDEAMDCDLVAPPVSTPTPPPTGTR